MSLTIPAQGLCATRVGIVYSQTTADQFYAPFAYSQLFMAMQHQTMMAGIPFDVLSADDLANPAIDLSIYDALIIPLLQQYAAQPDDTPDTINQERAKTEAITRALRTASENGVGILTSGLLLSSTVTAELIGIEPTGIGIWGEDATVVADDTSHPAMRHYAPNEEIRHYDANQIWVPGYRPVAGHNARILASLKTAETDLNGVLATENVLPGGGRNVHFANDQMMGDCNLVWQALQWVIYGTQTPVGLKLGRFESIFLARNDMDQSMYATSLHLTEVPLYNLLVDWKHNYNFVGSYYLNIGADTAQGMYTDWNVSGPLYTDFIALGNEIGTHSWTHPHYTSNLNATELEYEFNQSKNELNSQLGIEITGAAVPGNPEPLSVDRQLNSYFEYISGRAATVGNGYPGAFGYLAPEYDMLYFSLNMSPDFTLVEWLGYSPTQAKQVWAAEYADLLNHASQPIIHWLWHDYGPTITANIYGVAMYEDTIAMAFKAGSEFTTLDDIQRRIKALQGAVLDVAETAPHTVTVTATATEVGRSSLEITSTELISSVDNWYAYNENQVFLPKNGGEFTIRLAASQENITHVTALPMRADLMATAGNGTELEFSFEGQGTAIIHLARTDLIAHGADSTSLNGTSLEMTFADFGVHTVAITLCGNGIVDASEQCDDGNTQDGDCCSSSCTFLSSTTVCRPATGACDSAETCTGVSAECPVDTFVTNGASCDDDLFCNGTETCQNGTCEVGSQPCFGSGLCHEQNDTCQDGASIDVRVAAGSDDAEEAASGSMSLSSSDLELVDEDSNQTVGIRFAGITIPQDATVTKAYVQFQVDETSSSDSSLTIWGHAIGNAETFTTEDNNISMRERTTAQTLWSPDPWTTIGAAGLDQQTPDLSAVLQEIISRQDWAAGNSLALIITGTGERVAESLNGDPSGAPLLHLEYIIEEKTCNDGIDNDHDGAADCADSNCEGVAIASCGTGLPGICGIGSLTCAGGLNECRIDIQPGDQLEVCNDGLDNDCDGLADADDPDCLPELHCFDGIDDNGNGLLDCADPGCGGQTNGSCATLLPGVCADGIATCSNGTTACLATLQPGTLPELCNDGLDNDCDGLVDAADPDCSTTITFEGRISASSDDAEETASGNMSLSSSDLELVNDGSTQTVGMRFTGVAVPQDATITKAYIQFQVDETSSNTTSLLIWGHAIGNAETFTSEANNISWRARTLAGALWRPEPWTTTGAAGLDQQTSDLSSVLQEIVSRQDWSIGNSLAIIIAGTGARVAESFNGDSAGAPLLHVEYILEETMCNDGIDNDNDGPADCADSNCEGVVIDSCDTGLSGICGIGSLTCSAGLNECRINVHPGDQLEVCNDGLDNDCDGLLDADDPDCLPELNCFDGVDNNGNGLPDCADPGCGGQTDGSCATLLPGVCADGMATCSNGAAACLANILPGALPEICNDGLDNDCDGLTDAADPDCSSTFETRITASYDDAEEKASGKMSLSSSDLELVNDGSDQTVGLRFNGIDIPKDATITKAYIQFQTDETSSEATSLTIWGQATGSAETFSTAANNITARARTAAQALWSPLPWTTTGAAEPIQQSPDISPVIQEIVARQDWASGNSLALFIAGTGRRVTESFDGDSAGAPLLHVEYGIAQ